jgi:hypothetical protein
MRIQLLAAASVAALGLFAFTPATAASPSGYVDGGYSNYNSGFTGNIHDWNVTGAGNFPLGASSFSLQVDANYHGMNGSGFSFHTDEAELSLIWAHPMARLGASAGTNEIGGGGGGPHFQNYGGFAVFYPNQQWTVGLKGSALTCSGCSDFRTWGGEVAGYPTQNLALRAGYDEIDLPHVPKVETWSVGGEWQPTPRPWAVRLGFGNTTRPGVSVSALSIGFRWYFGGGSTLVQHHRDGAETWGTAQRGLLIFY